MPTYCAVYCTNNSRSQERGEKQKKKNFGKKKNFDISFDKKDIELISNNPEIFTSSEKFLDTKLCFDISFENKFLEMPFDDMLKCTNMKMNETQKNVLFNLAGCIIYKMLRGKRYI